VDVLDARADQALVELELRLADAAGADATLLTIQMRPAADQARRGVLELGELDLQLAFVGARALGEDVEDEPRARQHAGLEQTLEIALLRRGEVVIEDHQLRRSIGHERAQRLGLPPPEEQARARLRACRAKPPDDLGAGGPRQLGKLLHVAVGLLGEVHVHQDGAIAAFRAFEQPVRGRQSGPAQSSSPPAWLIGSRTGLVGTTVETACL